MIRPGEWDVIRRADEAGHFNDLWREHCEAWDALGPSPEIYVASPPRGAKGTRAHAEEKIRACWRKRVRARAEALIGHRVPGDFVATYQRAYGRPPGVGPYGRIR